MLLQFGFVTGNITVHSLQFANRRSKERLVQIEHRRCETDEADSHVAYRSHAAPMPFPCHAVPLRV